MKRLVANYILETVIPKFREIGESLTYIQGTPEEKLYYGKNIIQHIKKNNIFSLISDFEEVSPEDIVSRKELLQCLRNDLKIITRICAEHNLGMDYMFSEYKGLLTKIYPILPNIHTGVILDNGGKLIFLDPLTPGFYKERELAESSREIGSRITYVLGDKLYFKDILEFTYHYRNSLMKFG